MKYHSIRNIALAIAALVAITQVQAATFSLTNGSTIEGEINSAIEDQVKISVKGGSKSVIAISDFDSESQAKIAAWKNANPAKADVHTKWDEQPIIVSSKMPQLPEQFLDESFKGSARIELILDESGQVLHASVQDSTHSELEGPAIEATKSWKFQPALVDGKPVKSKLRVPFNFKNTPERKSVMDHIVPETAFRL